jgi:DNA replication protein DnaC
MKGNDIFMKELFRIVNGALRLDIDKVRNYTEFLADRLEKEGETVPAGRLRKLLQESDHQLRPTDTKFTRALPVDVDSRFPLIERVNLNANPEPDVFLADEQWAVVHEFVSVAKSFGQLEASGLGDSLSLLMSGPPGTGKSRVARYIARELDLDLYVARLDGVISSFLGSTSKNIRALFDFASCTPCVLFLDEFDAIAKLRGDSQEMGELKRVVNSFIQNLDALGPSSIVLAATNHQELLDAAVWRRFGYRLQLDYPSAEMRKGMWSAFLPPIEFTDKEIQLLVDLSDGFSGSDIQEVARRLRRRTITEKGNPTLKDAFAILRNLSTGEGESRRFLSGLVGKGEAESIQMFKARNSKLYSNAVVGQLLGMSKATAHRRSQSGAIDDG